MKKLLAVLALALVGCPGQHRLSDSQVQGIMGTSGYLPHHGARYQRVPGGWVDTNTGAPYRQGGHIPR